jgi:MFS family permease
MVERKVHEPLLSLNLFRNRVFTVSTIVTFLTSAGMFGAILYITLFAQGVVGVSATNSGLILMPMMFGLIFSSIVVGQIISRTGRYKIATVIGVAIAVLGMFLFSQLSRNTTQGDLVIRMVILGLGLGVTMPVFTIVVQAAFGIERLGEVTAGVALFRSLGGTVGAAVLGGIMNSQLTSRLTNVANDPFVTAIKQLSPNSPVGNVDANTIQGLLNPAGQAQVRSLLLQAPQPAQAQLVASFEHFLDAIKTAFSASLDHVFIIATILMGVAFVIVQFLPEISLRRAHQTVLQKDAELDAKLETPEAKDEPKL